MSSTRPTRRAFGRLAAVAATTFAALHVGWFALEDHLPARILPRNPDAEHLEWVRPGIGPATINGAFEDAQLVICGDSRTVAAIDFRSLDRSEFGPTSVQWNGGTDLRALLPFVIEQRPPLLVVAFSPHSFGASVNEMYEIVMDERPPFLPPNVGTPEEVDAWRRVSEERLEEAGLNPAYFVPTLRALQTNYELQRTLERWPQRRLDLALEMEASDVRRRLVTTIGTNFWHGSWWPPHDPTSSDRTYERKLRSKHFRSTHRSAGDVVAGHLREARTKGIRVAVARLPISPSLRAIEDAAIEPGWMESIAEAAGVPYMDFGVSELTSDGSHLTFDGAREFTTELVDALRSLEFE